ncbi:hypothetical protein J6590_104112 [Homalodisca vitripennis]|nr:hypothetical protein J6590_104112 [Homalodisca vitripennis]
MTCEHPDSILGVVIRHVWEEERLHSKMTCEHPDSILGVVIRHVWEEERSAVHHSWLADVQRLKMHLSTTAVCTVR